MRLKLAEENLARFKAQLRVAADKDSVRRQIHATEQIIASLKRREG